MVGLERGKGGLMVGEMAWRGVAHAVRLEGNRSGMRCGAGGKGEVDEMRRDIDTRLI